MAQEPVLCKRCGESTDTVRKGLCPRCFLQAHSGLDSFGACECCGYADPRVLTRRYIDNGAYMVLCANCAMIQWPRKLSLEELKQEVCPPDDRRQGDRRSGAQRRKVNFTTPLDLPKVDDRRGASR